MISSMRQNKGGRWSFMPCSSCSVSFMIKVFLGLLVVSVFVKYQFVSGNNNNNNESSVGGHGNASALRENRKNEHSDTNSLFVDISPDCRYNKLDFKILAEALQRGLGFYEQHADKLIVDAALGTRIVQGQLMQALRGHPKLPPLLSLYLRHMLKRAAVVSEKIVKSVEKSHINSIEKEHTLPWVGDPRMWEIPALENWEPLWIMKSYEATSDFMKDRLEYHEEFLEETTSDACIFQIFHCETEYISPECADLFLKREMSLYSLTHQVIYMLLAEKRQCTDNPRFTAYMENDDWRLFKEKLCGKVWLEANYIANSKFPALFRDLFTEQVGVCGMAGYPNFFRRDWLLQIMSWQSKRKSGCFLDPRQAVVSTEPPLANETETTPTLINFQYLRQPSRQKRSESVISSENENCSVHFTAVGIVALATHIRYYIDTCLPTY